MEALIEALIDSGYELVVCRDHLYTFNYGRVTVVVNTYTLTGGYAVSVVSYSDDPEKIRSKRINSIAELNALIRSYKARHKVDLKLYRAIRRNGRKKCTQHEMDVVYNQ